jgi:hypothetical protein
MGGAGRRALRIQARTWAWDKMCRGGLGFSLDQIVMNGLKPCCLELLRHIHVRMADFERKYEASASHL